MRSPSLIIALLLSGCAMQTKPQLASAPAAIEYYVHPGSQLDIQKGSSAWDALPEEVKTKYADSEEGVFEGTFAETADTLILQPRTSDTLAFCVMHTGRFLHQCVLSGIAAKAASGGYEFRKMETDDADQPRECVLRIRRTATQISISDSDDTSSYTTCKAYCGVHASFSDGIEFKLTERENDPDKIEQALGNNDGCTLPQ